MFSVKFLEHVVIGDFHCAKSGHTPSFQKTYLDSGQKEDVSGKPGVSTLYWLLLCYQILGTVIKYFATRLFPGPFLASYFISGFVIHKCCMIPWFPQPLTNEQEVCLLQSSTTRNK